jgi:hypothetical protein
MTRTTVRRTLATAAGVLGLAVAVGGTGLAGASTRPAASGTEHFQLLSTTGNTNGGGVIAYGAFTAAGQEKDLSNSTSRFVFPNGSFRIRHSNGTGTQHFNPKTCLLSIDRHGTYRISHGTGAYAGISGHGRYQLDVLAIASRNASGACAKKGRPAATQLIIQASGPVRR